MPRKRPEGLVMKGFRREIDDKGEPIEILTLADLHIGDPQSNEALIKDLINSVKDQPNRYAILAGDLMNTAIIGSKSDMYSERLRPQEQVEKCVALLEPIRDKILCIVPGNHEEQVYRQSGIDMVRMLAMQLDLLDVYSDNSALLIIRMGHSYLHSTTMTYSIYVNHGHDGGGRRAGSKMIHSWQEYSSLIDTDIFVIKNSRLPASFKQQTYRIVPQKACAVLHEQLFVNTASALTYGGYGNRGGYTPNSNSYPVIILDNRFHRMTVTL